MIVKQLKDKSNTSIQPKSPDKVAFPSNSGTVKTWGSTYTAPSDGWVGVAANTSDGTSEATLYINGVLAWTCAVGGTVVVRGGGIFPIKKDQQYSISGGSDRKQVVFYPAVSGTE